MNISQIATERQNERTLHIDELSTLEMVRLINDEDKKVAFAVEKELKHIAQAVDLIAEQLKNGGRLIYCGCGTSGRLGILDAAECPPTYSTDPRMVVGIIAGGDEALRHSIEGAEDNPRMGEEDLRKLNLCVNDVVVGIAASGRTPYVLGAMEYAHSVGAKVIALTCCPGSAVDRMGDIGIAPMPGAEVVTGSTRMKSGTAEKMVLNMLSTGTMIKLGKVYGNLMVDVKASNEKLVQRSISIVENVTGASAEEAKEALVHCNFQPKVAIVMLVKGLTAMDASRALEQAGGFVHAALKEA